MPKNTKHLTIEWKNNIGLANAITTKRAWAEGKFNGTNVKELLSNYNRKKKTELGYINSSTTRKKLSDIMKNKWKSGNISNNTKRTTFHKGFDARRINTQFKNGNDIRRGTPFTKEWRATIVMPIKDSSIEIKIQKFLEHLGIDYFKHKYINILHSYQCDIFIPIMNLVIECDGDYWHSYPTGREIDHIRTRELIQQGFKVLRLWESEIKTMDLNKFKEKLYRD